jgi:hypothetical protein
MALRQVASALADGDPFEQRRFIGFMQLDTELVDQVSFEPR